MAIRPRAPAVHSAPNHWFQVDLGRAARVGGVRIQWDSANPEGYVLETSLDGKAWKTAYTMKDSLGGVETLFFAPRQARYVRMSSLPVTSDWGVSIFEFEPLGIDASARVTGLAKGEDGNAVWQAGATHVVAGKGAKPGTRVLDIALPRPLSTAGLVVEWGGPRKDATLESRDGNGAWTTIGRGSRRRRKRQFLPRRARAAHGRRAAPDDQRKHGRSAGDQAPAPARAESA